MQLRNCPRCGKLFVAGGNYVCHECIERDEEDFDKVRKYIFENPNAHVAEVSEATEVSENKIMGYLRDGRLIGDRLQPMINCVSCGALIKTGSLCESCADKLAKEINDKVKTEDKNTDTGKRKSRSKMFTDRGDAF